jgi:hypothetical protein
MSRASSKPRQSQICTVVINGADGTVSVGMEIDVEVLVDRKIMTSRAEMVGTLAGYEAARLMALSDEDLRKAYERSVR